MLFLYRTGNCDRGQRCRAGLAELQMRGPAMFVSMQRLTTHITELKLNHPPRAPDGRHRLGPNA